MKNNEAIKIELVEGSSQIYFIFGGIAAGMGMPPYEFSKASNILSDSRVFIRDLRQAWYHRGLPGVSTNITETKNHLESIINDNDAKSVIMVGNSMGGFAALLFSSMIPKSKAIAFSPQTFVNPRKRLMHKDRRWGKQIFKLYLTGWCKEKIWDLKSITPVDGWSATVIASKTDKLDLLHAENVREVKGVDIQVFDYGGHNLVKSLRDNGLLEEILRNREI